MSHALPSCGAPVLIPRWEWRTFAPTPDSVRLLRELGVHLGASDHQELSLISLNSSHEVTIHERRLDLKWRKQLGQHGLELWDVVLDSPFPCTQESVHRLFEAWDLPIPILHRPYYTLQALILEVIKVHPGLRMVEVERHAESFSILSARCEWTRLLANRVPCECLSIEHEDPDMILQVVRSLGLQDQSHTSYPLGLKSVLHFEPHH